MKRETKQIICPPCPTPVVSGKLVRRRFKKLQVIADKTVQLHDVRTITLPTPAQFIQTVDTQVEFISDAVISGKVIKQFRVIKTIKYVPAGTNGAVLYHQEVIPFEAFVEAPVSPSDELDIENFIIRVVPVLEPVTTPPTTTWREKTVVDVRVVVSRIVITSALTGTADSYVRRAAGPREMNFISRID